MILDNLRDQSKGTSRHLPPASVFVAVARPDATAVRWDVFGNAAVVCCRRPSTNHPHLLSSPSVAVFRRESRFHPANSHHKSSTVRLHPPTRISLARSQKCPSAIVIRPVSCSSFQQPTSGISEQSCYPPNCCQCTHCTKQNRANYWD